MLLDLRIDLPQATAAFVAIIVLGIILVNAGLPPATLLSSGLLAVAPAAACLTVPHRKPPRQR